MFLRHVAASPYLSPCDIYSTNTFSQQRANRPQKTLSVHFLQSPFRANISILSLPPSTKRKTTTTHTYLPLSAN